MNLQDVSPASHTSDPPGAWSPARSLVRKALAPIERFLAIEASSGLMLVFAAGVALLWANSPLHDSYSALWQTSIGVSLGPFAFERDLHFLINDGLMTVFFFVVGLEIRREVHGGELRDVRRAALPLAAAAGGMIGPALIFLVLNHGHPSARGWGIPMATDIAFAVGALTLLGKRVVPAQRILLLALAVIDDVGAILVIALFYSSGVSPPGLVIACTGVVLILLMQALGVRSPWAYVVPALVLWAGVYQSGVHPTLAGVVVGLLTPAKAWLGPETLLDRIARLEVAQRSGTDRILLPHYDRLSAIEREAFSPLDRVEHSLHKWVAFGIMPLFALANAGVPIQKVSFAGDGLYIFVGIVAGLMLGKPLGIVLASWGLVRLRVSNLPGDVNWPRVGIVGCVGGIGFTMALFIAQLAFPSGSELEVAKIAILTGSVGAAIVSLAAGRAIPPQPLESAARSAREQEV